MASSLLIKKVVLVILTAFILIVSISVSVSAEAETSFFFTLQEDTVDKDDEVSKDSSSEIESNSTSPQTGDNTEKYLWGMLITTSGAMLAKLLLNYKQKVQ